MDSVTDEDIDRIFRRVEQEVDLRKVQSKADLFSTIRGLPRTRSWNTTLNDAVWERTQDRINTDVELYRYKAQARKETQFIGISSLGKKFYMIFSKKTERTQLVARDNKGRFTKYTKEELRGALA